MNVEISGKRLELLQEMLPRLARVAVLRNPSQSSGKEVKWPPRRWA
jgi:hypothetical protein